MTKTISNKYKTQNIKLGIILFLLGVIITFLLNTFILTQEKYYILLKDQFSFEQINKILAFKTTYGWISYLFNIFIFIKVVLVFMILKIWLYLSSIEINSSKIIRFVLIGEFIFLLQSFLRILFLKVYGISTLEELQNAYLFNLYSIFQSKQIPAYLIYPLAKLSIYEFLYWIILCIGIKRETGQTYIQSFKLVLSSYVLALIFFMMLVVLLMLTI